ncbi:protein kinase [Streptomyces sp. NPDC088732]|uniref:serine/threonine-protein kinase n=1 Tax=Streptomyces sp. NPDC088732 TaxID=3365879 RepID=UPI003829F1F1
MGGFVLRGRLGAGGMGRVFLGRSLAGRAVAVKVVHPHYAQQPEFRIRFRQEVTAARAVSGAFTAPVVAAGPDDDPPWLATVYVPGPSLSEAVVANGPLPEASLWPLMAGLVEALHAIHSAAIVHRDLKPSNVLLAADGPRVIDFGIARAIDGTALTATGTVIGTAGFMSPEQAVGGQAGPATDVFSLGAVVTFAANGTGPFGEGPSAALLYRIVHAAPVLDGVPSPLRDLIAACLIKDPVKRPTLTELATAIAERWTPPEEFSGAVSWPTAVTSLIQNKQTPVPKLPAAALQLGDGATHPPTARDIATSSSTLLAFRKESRERFRQAQRIGDAGDARQAARLMADLAAERQRVEGPDHEGTLLCRSEHAHFVGEAGDLAEALRLTADLAIDSAQALGPDHPGTLRRRAHHARLVGDAGDPAQAAQLLADLFADRARVQGPDHKDTLECRSLQAHFVGAAGDPTRAAILVSDLANDCARVLGPDNRNTLNCRAHHARLVGDAGDPAQGAQLMADVATDSKRTFGPDTRDTLNFRRHHARLVRDAGDPAKAAQLIADAAADTVRVLGRDHTDTLECLEWHARLMGEAGDPVEAVRLMTGVAAECARVLGPDHRVTRSSRSHLTYWQERAALH